MYGIFTYSYHKNQLNVGKYTIHGWYGSGKLNPKNPDPDPSRKIVGLMVENSHPQVYKKGNPGFLGHIWILRVMIGSEI